MNIEESLIGHIAIISAVFIVCWGYVSIKNKINLKRKLERWAK